MKSIHNNESVPSRSQTGRALPAALVSPPRTIAGLREAAAACKACHLWKKATQTVFGEGPTGARIILVGGQPGDQEDRSGHPFVGPAGRLLDEALAKAGIEHEAVYVTNVVKHFKWTASERGKRRIHKKPRYSEIQACRQPGQRVDSSLAPHVMATVHPSSILRAPDEKSRQAQMRAFINDLRRVARLVGDEQAA